MNRVRIGVVGLCFGQQHVRTLVNMMDAELVAVADRSSDLSGGLEGWICGPLWCPGLPRRCRDD